MAKKKKREPLTLTPKVLIKGLAFMVSLGAILWGVREANLTGLLNEQWIDTFVKGKGFEGELLFIAVGAIVTAVGLPRQIIASLGGYAFGFALGTGLALAATLGGCIFAFVYARVFGRGAVRERFSGRVKKVDKFLRANPFTMTLLIRFLPVGSNLATNLIAGVSSVSAGAFFAGSAVGYLPQTIVFALLGSGVSKDGGILEMGLSGLLFVASAFMGVYLFQQVRKGRKVGAKIEDLIGPAPDDEPEPETDEDEDKKKDDDPFA